MALTDAEIANVVFNETRSLSGEDIATARKNVAHSIMNAIDKNNGRGDFFGLPIKTQVGPLDNSYPTDDQPASNIYANTYGR
ncbi:MAG: hypothetical protein ACTHL8_09660 [Burkholderiaceae bacterium]